MTSHFFNAALNFYENGQLNVNITKSHNDYNMDKEDYETFKKNYKMASNILLSNMVSMTPALMKGNHLYLGVKNLENAHMGFTKWTYLIDVAKKDAGANGYVIWLPLSQKIKFLDISKQTNVKLINGKSKGYDLPKDFSYWKALTKGNLFFDLKAMKSVYPWLSNDQKMNVNVKKMGRYHAILPPTKFRFFPLVAPTNEKRTYMRAEF